ncbi:hypothetical protein [Antribacter gilvus]|uniref:hypothetical protein n=1 Tax=Antribacter gilvus TaxID=2304675 RepID=UPI0013DE97BE|nr:hypothetical protein [Antribacter gilvus]
MPASPGPHPTRDGTTDETSTGKHDPGRPGRSAVVVQVVAVVISLGILIGILLYVF